MCVRNRRSFVQASFLPVCHLACELTAVPELIKHIAGSRPRFATVFAIFILLSIAMLNAAHRLRGNRPRVSILSGAMII